MHKGKKIHCSIHTGCKKLRICESPINCTEYMKCTSRNISKGACTLLNYRYLDHYRIMFFKLKKKRMHYRYSC